MIPLLAAAIVDRGRANARLKTPASAEQTRVLTSKIVAGVAQLVESTRLISAGSAVFSALRL